MNFRKITYKIAAAVLAIGLTATTAISADAAMAEHYLGPVESDQTALPAAQTAAEAIPSLTILQNQAQAIQMGSEEAAALVKATMLRQEIVSVAKAQLGGRYSWGGKSPSGFDCSGLVYYVFGQLGYDMNRTATAQLDDGVEVAKEDLLPGDLVFFKGTSRRSSGRASHVGIYIGDGLFIHASNSGVKITELSSNYYTNHYLTARRVINP